MGKMTNKTRFEIWRSVVAPSDAIEKNRNIGAQLQSILYTTAEKKILENLLSVGLLMRTNLLIPSRFWTTYSLYELPQTLHGDRARRAHHKRYNPFFDPTYSFSYRVHGKIWPNLPTRGFSAITQ